MKYQALEDRIIVRVDDPVKKTKAGIELPERAQHAPDTGVIVSVGWRVADYKPGQHVMFGQHAGTPIRIKAVPHVVLCAAELICELFDDDEPAEESTEANTPRLVSP